MNKALLPLLLCCFIFPASGKDAGWQWYNEKINPKEKENKPVPAAPRQEPDIMQKLAALQTATKRALYEAILAAVPEALRNGPALGAPHILNMSFPGVRGEVLLHMLDDAGVMVGTGSACSSKNRYSRVMLACGLNERAADGVLRISFAATTTEEEVSRAIPIINSCAAALAERTK